MQKPMGTTHQRLIAIGDIHGHAKALKGVLDQIQPTPNDTIVTLGDCVNRGPESREVLNLLIELQQICQLVSILGNHDDMMIAGRDDGSAFVQWMALGGKPTLRSYGQELSNTNVPDSHWELLNSFVPFYETEDFIFTHANYCWYWDMKEQPGRLLRWCSLVDEIPEPHISGKTVILGHTPGQVRDAGHYCCIDTGCGFGGILTAMEVHTGRLWHATESGDVASASDCEIF